MKRANKLIALFLAIIMAFSMFTLPAYAVETEESKQAETTTEQTESEDVVDTIEKIFDIIIEILKMIHELVGSILVAVGEECPFCGEVHTNDKTVQKPDDDNIYTVTFNLNYEDAPVVTQNVIAGKCATVPDIPEKDGSTFIGWYTDSNCENLFNFSTIITTNLILYAGWLNNPYSSAFSANETSFVVGYEETILFTLHADENAKNVNLYMNAENIGTMLDDGTNGDEFANDGIFTYTCKIFSHEETTNTYYAVINDLYESNKEDIRFYNSLTIEDYEEFITIFDEIKNIEELYKDENGNIINTNKNNCFFAVEEYVKSLQENGLVHYYEYYKTDDELISMTIKLASGFQFVFVPSNNKTLASGKQLAIMTQLNAVFDTSQDINTANNLLGYSVTNFSENGDSAFWITDHNVTLNTFNQMGRNQVILWLGHGVPANKGTYLDTQEPYDKIRYWVYDPVYFVDRTFIQDEMCITTDGTLAVNYKYLNNNLPDLTGSFVYLNSCYSGDDSNLCNAFINKGASSLIAIHNSIGAVYATKVQAIVGAALAIINPETNNYYTVSEALTEAFNRFGTNDGDGAYPYIYMRGTLKGNYRIANAETGSLSGKICKASDRTTAISNAVININRYDSLFKQLNSSSSGNYSATLVEGNYYIEIVSDGYIPFRAYANIQPNTNTFMETFLLVEGEEGQVGTASGVVYNSLSGSGIADVTLTIKRDWNNTFTESEVIATTKTSSGGNYSIELPLGNYTFIAEKDGFVSESFNIIVQNGTTANQNGTITPIISGDDYLITLTWGANPRDLDSHMVGTLSDGNSFHVYFSHKSQMDGSVEVCNLDYDDTTSYGPEHITLNATNSSPYYYYIYRYSGSGTVASSGAKVTVHQGNTLIAEFNVPTNLGSADYWNVFAIKDGELIINNTITSSANTSYAE